MTKDLFNDSMAPLTSDALIEARVNALIGCANMRQLWLLFLDSDDYQLPLVIPIDGLPRDPKRKHTSAVVRNVAELMNEIGAVALVIVVERDGPATLSPSDYQWAHQLAKACRSAGLGPRAILLSHRRGIRWIAPDDYAFAPSRKK
jgi:hypothetical protein